MPININGGSRRAGGWWAKHLGNNETNERVELVEMRGLGAETIEEAFQEMRGLAAGTKCINYFYQANINPRADEHLTPKQWQEAVDRLEANLGLQGRPRFVIEHEKEGRVHRHIVWSRIDTDRGIAISDSLTAQIHERTSRELEVIFDLERGKSVLVPDRENERTGRGPEQWEKFRGASSGIDPKMVAAECLSCWQRTDNGASFKAALELSGDYVLARGDRRDFVVVDRAGDSHSLGRRLGIKAAEVRARLVDLDPAKLPSVKDAAALQRGRRAEAATQHKAEALQPSETLEAKSAKGLTGTVAAIRLAWSLSRTASQLEDALAARCIGLAQVTPDEAYSSARRGALAKAAGRFAPVLDSGEIVAVDGRGYTYRLDKRTTGNERADIEGRLAGIDRNALMSVAATAGAMREASQTIWREQKEAERSRARMEAPVSGVAAEIRMAWSLSSNSPNAERLQEALAARSMTLARTTAADAEASHAAARDYAQRMQAEAKDVFAATAGLYAQPMQADAKDAAATNQSSMGRRPPILMEGQIVVVNGHGSIYRLDERTTGMRPPDMEARLAGLDGLLSVSQAQDAMREAAREGWRSERHAAWEKARPASTIEARIATCAGPEWRGAFVRENAQGECLSAADALAERLRPAEERASSEKIVYGKDAFAVRLADAGIAIARVTETDMIALAALRHDEQMARFAAETNKEERRTHHFGEVVPGDLCAVTRGGDVFQINTNKLGEAAAYLTGDQVSVVQARAAFELDHAQTTEVFAAHRDELAAGREALAAEREELVADGEAARARRDMTHDAVDAADAAVNAGGKLLGGVAKVLETGFSLFFGWAMAPPKRTAQQIRDEIKADTNLETLHADQVAADQRSKDAAYDWQQEAEIKAAQQRREQDERLAAMLAYRARAASPLAREETERDRD